MAFLSEELVVNQGRFNDVLEEKERLRDLKMKNATEKLQRLINRVLKGEEWEQFNENTPETITFPIVYPDGKSGDIDMFIAQKYGVIKQIGAIEYMVTMPTAMKEQVALMLYIYALRTPERIEFRNELAKFMYEYNLYHRLRQQCDDFMWEGCGTHHELRTQGRKIAQEYIEKIREKRKIVYSEVLMKGETSARWVSEQKAYAIVKEIYNDALFQYNAEWLGYQSLDIYVPSKKLAIEYQGIQHYHAVSLFGGESGLEKRKLLDEAKRRKCADNGVLLLEWRYDEPLTEEFIKSRILNGK